MNGEAESAPVSTPQSDGTTFWLVDGDVAMLNKGSRGAARFFPGKGWSSVPAFSIEDEGQQITEAEFDAIFEPLLEAAKKALNTGK